MSEKTGQDGIDQMTDRLLDEASTDPFIAKVYKLLDECSSLEEFRDKLLDVYNDLDPAALGNVMERAFSAAELAGRFKIT